METPNTQYEKDRRALEAILKALRENPIPLKSQKMRELPGGGNKAFAPWQAYVDHLNRFAPDAWDMIPSSPSAGEAWYAERDPKNKKKITGYRKIQTTSVSIVLTIKVGSASISRGSVGTVKATETGKGLPADSAKAIGFRGSARLFGIDLEREKGRKTNDYTNGAARNRGTQKNEGKPNCNNGNEGAIRANQLIEAAERCGVSTRDLMTNSKELFSKSISALSADQVDELASELGITM